MLKNKTVFITGASSGIGKATAIRFAKEHAKLVVCARNIEELNNIVKKFPNYSEDQVLTLQMDVRHLDDVKAKIASIPTTFRDIDILINNAGLAAGLDTIQEASIDDWEQMIDTNVKGLLYVTRLLLPSMIERNVGHIINLGSIAGHYVYPKGAVYCATKFAVDALSNGLRMDLFGTKLRVSSISPGAVETNFSNIRFKGDENKAKAVYQGMEPLSADDIADAIFYCASRPPHVNISEIIIMPTDQAAATMVARKG